MNVLATSPVETYMPKHFHPPLQRFVPKIEFTDTCWIWTAQTNHSGYGVFWSGERGEQAHRFSYMVFVGPIPDGHEIDHLCKVVNCVNPDHLEAVTQYENNMRSNSNSATNKRKTECPNGHPYGSEHGYRYSNGKRRCRTCSNAYSRDYYYRRKAEGTWGTPLAQS